MANYFFSSKNESVEALEAQGIDCLPTVGAEAPQLRSVKYNGCQHVLTFSLRTPDGVLWGDVVLESLGDSLESWLGGYRANVKVIPTKDGGFRSVGVWTRTDAHGNTHEFSSLQLQAGDLLVTTEENSKGVEKINSVTFAPDGVWGPWGTSVKEPRGGVVANPFAAFLS